MLSMGVIYLLITGSVVIIVVALYLFSGKKSSSALLIKDDLNELNKAVISLKEGLQEQITDR